MTKDKVTEAVNAWFRLKFRGGPLARDTDAYNAVFSALPDLVSDICALSPTEPAAATSAEHEQEN